MNKAEYINELRKHTKEQGMTYHAYYENYAKRLRSPEKLDLMSWELKNPFITELDIKTILFATDDQVATAFADAMTTMVMEYEKTMPEPLPRKDVEEVIDAHVEALARGEIVETVDEELEKEVLEPLVLNGIDKLNGFAVIKEDKTNRVHLFYHEGNKSTLTGEVITTSDAITVDSGYYVNFELAIYQILGPLLGKYKENEEIRFIREDGQERTRLELVEEAYQILKNRGALKFGKAIEGEEVPSFQSLIALPKREEKYKGHPLQSGLYVRRDILLRIFAKYKAKVTRKKEEEKATEK